MGIRQLFFYIFHQRNLNTYQQFGVFLKYVHYLHYYLIYKNLADYPRAR